MKQHYFVVVLAHSLHGRLRRIHVPHHALYVVLGLALLGSVSLFGMVSSYFRMYGKVAGFNSLREEVATLRGQNKELQRENNRKNEQLASLQVMASEVSLALGLKRRLEGADDIASEGPLVPTFNESIEEYNFLKSASFSRVQRNFPRQWLKNTMPSQWPLAGQITSRYGDRTDPFSGEGGFHTGLDISAKTGTPVYAAADGIVHIAQYSGRYGRLIVIDHGSGTATWYAHLSQFQILAGEEIRRGQLIGYSGASGQVSGPHLHFEVRQGGNPVNPSRFLSGAAVVRQVRPDLPF
jgi:murein DD-endopeptidase MepM/ murein hydrolase activator NlpD